MAVLLNVSGTSCYDSDNHINIQHKQIQNKHITEETMRFTVKHIFSKMVRRD